MHLIVRHTTASDHRAVSIKVQLSLRAKKIRKTKKIPYYWSKLKDDEQVMRNYTVDIVNRFQVLQNLNNDDETADSMYKNIVEAHKKAAETHIPLKPKQIKHVPWESSDVTNKRQKLKDLNNIKNANLTEENVSKVTAAKKDLDLAYEEEQRNYIQEKVSIIEEAHEN